MYGPISWSPMTQHHTFTEKPSWYLLSTVPWGFSPSHKWEFLVLTPFRLKWGSSVIKFPNRWIGRGGARNWPPRSPDLNPLDYHVWVYMKALVYAHKMNTREELLQRILSAARSINNAAVLHVVTSSLFIRVRKCIKAYGGHFEQFA